MSKSFLASAKAVLFDLDGTLVDSLPDILYAVREMESDLSLEPVTQEQVRDWIGNGASVLVRRVLARHYSNPCDEKAHETALSVFMHHYQNIPEKRTVLYPGAITLLKTLSDKGVKLGLVTNKPSSVTHPLLHHLSIDGYFSVALGGGDVPKAKPDPMILTTALEHLGIKSAHAVMVGDSKNDVLAAKAANIHVIGLEGGYNHGEDIRVCEPDVVVPDLESLLALI